MSTLNGPLAAVKLAVAHVEVSSDSGFFLGGQKGLKHTNVYIYIYMYMGVLFEPLIDGNCHIVRATCSNRRMPQCATQWSY